MWMEVLKRTSTTSNWCLSVVVASAAAVALHCMAFYFCFVQVTANCCHLACRFRPIDNYYSILFYLDTLNWMQCISSSRSSLSLCFIQLMSTIFKIRCKKANEIVDNEIRHTITHSMDDDSVHRYFISNIICT